MALAGTIHARTRLPLTASPCPSMVRAMFKAHNASFGICREIIRT